MRCWCVLVLLGLHDLENFGLALLEMIERNIMLHQRNIRMIEVCGSSRERREKEARRGHRATRRNDMAREREREMRERERERVRER